ncbi:ICOS ligand-like [Pristis pectinata]|uniref:ICOS ligand-like n=1 Tax=Pristis pectinata TaxID=685728 RepID=UPI00223CAB3C|nr:ICOS ligand-like [Pristis pectinata]
MPVFLLGMTLIMITAAEQPPLQVTGTIGGEVVLPYNNMAGYKRVYWQKSSPQTTKEKLVNALCPPAEACSHNIDPSYAGRSEFLANSTRGDFSLLLRDLSVDDEGIYKCVLQNEGISKETVNLSVVANYSQPVVSGNSARAGYIVNLTCTSSGGYPLAALEWVNKTSGVLLGEGPNPTTYSRDHLQLYLLRSVLLLREGCGTLSVVTCRIRTQSGEILWPTHFQVVSNGQRETLVGSARAHSASPVLSSTIAAVSLLMWHHL